MATDGFRLGRWRAICDRCGFAYYNTDLQKEWTGLMVCSGPGTNECHEVRHPQEYVKGVRDQQAPPWTRPRPTEIFTSGGPVMQDGEIVKHGGAVVYYNLNDVSEDDL